MCIILEYYKLEQNVLTAVTLNSCLWKLRKAQV